MSGTSEIDNLFILGFVGLVIFTLLVGYFIFGVWKHYKTPKEQRGDKDLKVQYFILATLLVNIFNGFSKKEPNNIAGLSIIVSIISLGFVWYLFFLKKIKLITPQILVVTVLTIYLIYNIGRYLLK